MSRYRHADLVAAIEEVILRVTEAFALLHGTTIVVDRQEGLMAEGIENLLRQASEATQRRQQDEAAIEAVNAEAAKARKVVAATTSKVEGLRQALQYSKDEATRFKAEALKSRSEDDELRT
ncbi:hypothetical protein GUJ93_ZPchr0002g24676 [Zizania palustris]|uniref:Uncharacterized protein n=1 Tax=Zizania palustris TaxID=103762 RepID=A0A8J5SR85_ZIZPA|nr:hypothetical protein GUJ93_ZPchr0002g24676 [Zizania palustris]